jgi:succinate dehydrogenase / fumarate reductase flavoprotein subunit
VTLPLLKKDVGFGVNKTGETVYLDFAAAIQRYGKEQAHKKGLDEKILVIIKLGTEVVANKYGALISDV